MAFNPILAAGLVAPALDVLPVTPSDNPANNFPAPCRAIRATAAGNVALVTLAGDVRVCAFQAGETRAIRAIRINSTNTTATGLEAML